MKNSSRQRAAAQRRKISYAVNEYFQPRTWKVSGPTANGGPVWHNSMADQVRYLRSLDPTVLIAALGTLVRSGRVVPSRARCIRRELGI